MAVDTTGAAFKRFFADGEFWPADSWHDDTVVRIDGKLADESIDLSVVPDCAEIRIEGGYVFRTREDEGVDLILHFRRWQKKQTLRRLLVEVDASKLEGVIAAITAAGGKVANQS